MSTIGGNYGLPYQVTTPTITQGTTTGTSATSTTPQNSTSNSQSTPQYEPVTANAADVQATYALAGMGLGNRGTMERIFDEQGNVVKIIISRADGSKTVHEYEYDENGICEYFLILEYDAEGVLLSSTKTKLGYYNRVLFYKLNKN